MVRRGRPSAGATGLAVAGETMDVDVVPEQDSLQQRRARLRQIDEETRW
jgi:hypothetical protein